MQKISFMIDYEDELGKGLKYKEISTFKLRKMKKIYKQIWRLITREKENELIIG